MTSVYLPIEVSRREVVSKSLLASSLATAGHDVYIFQSDFFDRAGWPGPGIYIGKNVFRSAPPHDLSFYKRMKQSNISVWHLDEEGGIYLGDSESEWRNFLSRRYDPLSLDKDDKVLAWGDWQAEFFAQQGLSAPMHVTGHMNFDICRPKYAEALSSFDFEQTGGASDYILINTRFALSNAPVIGDTHLIHSAVIRGFFDRNLMFDKIVVDGHLYYDFIEMIFALSKRLPDRQIVLRPHPAEDAESYRRLFSPIDNVLVTGDGDVGSWIRRASCIVHNGCTTAIQAIVAGKPVITYMPRLDDPRTTACLPNSVGIIAKDLKTVVKLIEKGQNTHDAGHWHRTISELDTIAMLTDMVNSEPSVASTSHALTSARLRGLKFSILETIKSLGRKFMPSKAARFRHNESLFDRAFFDRIPELIGAGRHLFSPNLECKKINAHCFVVRNAKRNLKVIDNGR
jgi:surface carbohydrate biosynthesis protein